MPQETAIKGAHTSDQWDFQLTNLDSKFKGVKENIIFGQHSNK